jgi:tetratricopeptide (TPR) repeat protein
MRTRPLSRRLVVSVAALALAGAACRRPSDAPASAAPAAGGLAEVKALIDAGQVDEALARLESAPAGPEALYLRGRAWTRKAETAPLPTPLPPAPDAPRGAPPPRAPELKDEELKALSFFDQAARADARFAAAPLAAAELLAPHALRAFDQQALQRGKRAAAPVYAVAPGEPDWTPDGVLKLYQQAVSADTRAAGPVEALLAFALRVGKLDEADAGFRELIRRNRESADPLLRYGDFLREKRGEGLKAADQYQQALIWRPDDEATRAKLADVYLELGIEHFKKREYLAAQARLDEAQKYIRDPSSPQAARLKDYNSQIREIRGGR